MTMTSRPSSPPVPERTLAIAAVTAMLLYGALGWYVSARPPGEIDRAVAAATLGHGTLLATLLWRSGLFPAYATLIALQAIGALALRDWLYVRRVAFSAVTLLLLWAVSDRFKDLFRRARPDAWIVHHETSFSYASGHAALATGYWVLWAIFMWYSPLPPLPRRVFALAFPAIALAIGWSRLALGAHYLTDVLGGYLLGAAWLAFILVAERRLRLALFA